jgi:hypothetical protein
MLEGPPEAIIVEATVQTLWNLGEAPARYSAILFRVPVTV